MSETHALKEVVDKMISQIKDKAVPVKTQDDLTEIATVSANNRVDIGAIVGEAVFKAGKDGLISVEVNGKPTTEIELHEGYVNDGGSMSPMFLREQRQIRLQDAMVLIVDQVIEDVDDIKDLMNEYVRVVHPTGSPLVIVCRNMVGSAMASVLHNLDKYPIYVVKAPTRSLTMTMEMLDDLRTVIGSQYIYSNVGGHPLKKASLVSDKQGVCDVVIEGDRAIFIPADSGDKDARVEMLKKQLAGFDQDDNAFADITDRIARIQGAHGKIKFHAPSSLEMGYLYELYDDAVKACFSALRDGYVNGGGDIYLDIADKSPIGDALRFMVEKMRGGEGAGNLIKGAKYRVVEPATVPINVLTNAFSVAEQVLNTKYLL